MLVRNITTCQTLYYLVKYVTTHLHSMVGWKSVPETPLTQKADHPAHKTEWSASYDLTKRTAKTPVIKAFSAYGVKKNIRRDCIKSYRMLWWSIGESNPWPLQCHCSALPTALMPLMDWPHNGKYYIKYLVQIKDVSPLIFDEFFRNPLDSRSFHRESNEPSHFCSLM